MNSRHERDEIDFGRFLIVHRVGYWVTGAGKREDEAFDVEDWDGTRQFTVSRMAMERYVANMTGFLERTKLDGPE